MAASRKLAQALELLLEAADLVDRRLEERGAQTGFVGGVPREIARAALAEYEASEEGKAQRALAVVSQLASHSTDEWLASRDRIHAELQKFRPTGELNASPR